jgi:Xaa-Pro dipeptidase
VLFNRKRALEFMRQCKLDALVATSPVNITYFTGYFCWLDSLTKCYMMQPGGPSTLLLPGFAVFPSEHEPAAVLLPAFAVNGADMWVRDIRVFGSSGFDLTLNGNKLPQEYARFADMVTRPATASSSIEALVEVLQARRLTDGRIGLECEGLPADTLASIRAALPKAKLLDCTNLIRLIRMVKSEEEIRRMTRAAEVSEDAAMTVLSQAREGTSLAEMTQTYRELIARGGAELDHFCIAIRGLGMATEPDYRLAADDILFVDYGCIYQRYFSDSGLTLALTELSETLQRKYAALHACVSAGRAIVRPGVRSSAVRNAMWAALEAHGHTASFPHGHGLGLEVRDYPILVADNGLRIRDECIDVPSDLPLETDMVINLESSMFMSGAASLHIEHSFIVTDDGCRLLTPQDRNAPHRGARKSLSPVLGGEG